MKKTPQQRIQLTGRYAGPISRLLGFVLDNSIITLTYTGIAAVIAYLAGLLTDVQLDPGHSTSWAWGVGFLIWAFTYSVVSLTVAGRTLGMGLVGMRVVQRDGSTLRIRYAIVRTFAVPFTFIFTLGIGFIGLVIGREHRGLQDVLARTTVIYDWGDRPAELPGPLTKYLEHRQAVPTAQLDPTAEP